jgi:hypothetical protein
MTNLTVNDVGHFDFHMICILRETNLLPFSVEEIRMFKNVPIYLETSHVVATIAVRKARMESLQ